MPRETWGTYSVRDHLAPQAWIADVFVYDRLVVPVPPPSPDEGPEVSPEWNRWKAQGWQPERQKELLSILEERAFTIPWTTELQQQWRDFRAPVTAGVRLTSRDAVLVDPWSASGQVLLTQDLPSYVTGVNAVATYRSLEEFENAVKLRHVEADAHLPVGQAVVIIGREYLVPAPEESTSDEDLLRKAVEISGDSDYARRRTAYWHWQRDFLSDERLMNPASIKEAVQELGDLIADEQRLLNAKRNRLITLFAFSVATAGVGLFTDPISPITIAGAFLSVGNFVAGEALQSRGASPDVSPAGLLISAGKHMGWPSEGR